MKKLLFILLFFISLFSQAQVTFQRNYVSGFLQSSYAYWITQTQDSGYVLIGDQNGLFILKTDLQGNILFVKTFTGNATPGNTVEMTGVQCSDGGFIVTGFTWSNNYDIFLLKLSSSGNILWEKDYGTTGLDVPRTIQETNDKGFIITGYSQPDTGIIFLKTDSAGNMLWTKKITNGNNSFGASCIKQTLDGGYIITGDKFNITLLAIIKTDASGNVSWMKTYGNNSYQMAGEYILPLQDSTYILLISTLAGPPYYSISTQLIKIDKAGNIIWDKHYNKNNNQIEITGYKVIPTKDKGFLICGGVLDSGLLIKTDSLGNIIWNKVYLGGNFSDVKQSFDGEYVISGWGYYGGAGVEESIIVKTDTLGNGGCNDTTITITVDTSSFFISMPIYQISSSSLSLTSSVISATNNSMYMDSSCVIWIYSSVNETICLNQNIFISPNPFSTNASVEVYGYKGTGIIKFEMFDVFGRDVKQFVIRNSSSFVISRDNLPSGIYFYKLSGSTEVLGTGKIIVE